MDKYDLHENKPVGRTIFHMVRTRTSFDAKAKGNSGMAYQLVNTIFSRVEQNSWHTFVLEVEPEKRPLLKMAPKNK